MKRTQQGRCRGRSRREGTRARWPRPRTLRIGGGQDVGVQQEADWQAVLAALAGTLTELETVAREHGAFLRRREVRCAADLLRLVLVYAVGEPSLRMTAAWATVAGVAAVTPLPLPLRLPPPAPQPGPRRPRLPAPYPPQTNRAAC